MHAGKHSQPPHDLGAASDVMWPEHPLPAHIEPAAVSMLDHHGTRVVWGEGNPEAPIIIVLDNPGAKEDREGNSFVCGTRLTLRQALGDAGLAPSDCYITFLLKRRPTRAYDRIAAYASYRPLLDRQVRDQRPDVLVFCGGTVVNALLDPEVEIKQARGKTFQYMATPVVATYHPLACRRRPQLLSLLVSDLALARSLLNGN